MTDPACTKCGTYAARLCRTCGPLCTAHTCEHLRSTFEVIEVDPSDCDGIADDPNSNNIGYTYEDIRSNLKSFLSDEAMVASMTDEMLRTALARYKAIVRFIENEITSRSIYPRNSYRPRYRPYNSSRTGEASNKTPRRKKKDRSPAERLLEAIKKGYITKDIVEAFLAKAKAKTKEKE